VIAVLARLLILGLMLEGLIVAHPAMSPQESGLPAFAGGSIGSPGASAATVPAAATPEPSYPIVLAAS
jgi:hypothetical protein